MTVITFLTLLAAAVVLTFSFLSICDMSSKTNHFVRLAYLLLAAAEFAIFIGPAFGIVMASWVMAVLNVGIALLCVCDRLRHRFNVAGRR